MAMATFLLSPSKATQDGDGDLLCSQGDRATAAARATQAAAAAAHATRAAAEARATRAAAEARMPARRGSGAARADSSGAKGKEERRWRRLRYVRARVRVWWWMGTGALIPCRFRELLCVSRRMPTPFIYSLKVESDSHTTCYLDLTRTLQQLICYTLTFGYSILQMALYLAEASRYFVCTDLFREPSKYAWSDYYEGHFIVPNQRVALVTNKRVILLQHLDLDKMDKKPSKILWDVPWEEVLSLELAKAGYQRPSHVIIHLKNFRRSENFFRLIKCNVDEERQPQALLLCSSIRKMWRSHQADMKFVQLKVPSGQHPVCFASDDDRRESHSLAGPLLSSREMSSNVEQRFINHTVNFQKMWSSEQEIRNRCKLLSKQVADDGRVFSIWRPLCPSGYVSIGDVAHVGTHSPHFAAIYKNVGGNFALPLGYDLVWRNCAEDYRSCVSIWLPRPPEGYVTLGCVAVSAFEEPPLDCAFCVNERLAEDAVFEEQIVWASSDAYPWGCYIYQVQSGSLQFMAFRLPKEQSELKPKKISDSNLERASETMTRKASMLCIGADT